MFIKVAFLFAAIYTAQAFSLRESSFIEILIENAEELRIAVIDEQAKLNEVKQRMNNNLQNQLTNHSQRFTSHSFNVYQKIQDISSQKGECMLGTWEKLQIISMESTAAMSLCYSTTSFKLNEIQTNFLFTTNGMLENMYSAVQTARNCGDDTNCQAIEVGKYIGLNIKMLKTVEDLKKQINRQSAKKCFESKFNDGSVLSDDIYSGVETCVKQ